MWSECGYIVGTSLEAIMKARLVRIGNSRGVRLPKPLIEEARLKEEVQLRVRDGAVIITSVTRPRSGWARAASLISGQSEDRLLDEPTPTEFDQGEWRWR
jgi:antitoxin MazE